MFVHLFEKMIIIHNESKIDKKCKNIVALFLFSYYKVR